MTSFLTPRKTNALLALCGVLLIATALIMQEILGMHPCPLCITQRLFVIATGAMAFIAFLHNPGASGVKCYGVVGALLASAGASFSARHVWLQNLPEDLVPACGPGLSYMFENFPVTQAFELLLMGDGNCSEVVWSLFGISIPGWMFLGFSGLVVINLWQIFRKAS